MDTSFVYFCLFQTSLVIAGACAIAWALDATAGDRRAARRAKAKDKARKARMAAFHKSLTRR